MGIISVNNLKTEGLKMELKNYIEDNSPLIGDYLDIGTCFIPAVSSLGFKYDNSPDSPALIRIILDPKEYKSINKPIDAYDIICKVKELREKIVEYVNQDLKMHAGDILPNDDDKLTTKHHMIDFGHILTIVMPYAYTAWFSSDKDIDKVKSDFEWLIRELKQAGYRARFFTSPREVKIQVSISMENLIKK